MKTEYENKLTSDDWIKDSKWTTKDFKHKNILFFKIEEFPNPGKYEKFKFDDYYKIFAFSEPIYYDKKYAVFTKKKTDTSEKAFADTSVIIMEKIDGKWKIVKDVGDGIYY